MRFPPTDPADRAVLRRVLERAGPGSVVVFDLDSTVLDNRPRQARILREYGATHGVPELTRSRAEDWPHGFGFEEPFRAVGLVGERGRALAREVRPFWAERFFTSEYCVEDVPIPGAPAYVRGVHGAGASVAYCTGRTENMRAGTLTVLARHGFPVPGDSVRLIMKASPDTTDDLHKERIPELLAPLGTVLAVFDNEPTHVNTYHRAYPDAFVVHVATDHSGRRVEVAKGVPAIPDFELP